MQKFIKNIIIFGANSFFSKLFIEQINNKNLDIRKKNIYLIFRNNSKRQFKKFKYKNIYCFDNKILNNKKFITKINDFYYFALIKNGKKDIALQKKIFNQLFVNNFKGNILYTSTGGVYSKNQLLIKVNNKYQEDLILKKKIHKTQKNIYSNFKIESEKICKYYSKKGLKIVIARCFTLLGNNLPLNKHFVIGNILNSALNKTVFIKKNPNKVVRSFISEEDLIKILTKLINYANNQIPIYNVGSDEKINIDELLVFLRKKINLKFLLKKNSNKIDYYVPDISKLRKLKLQPKDKFKDIFFKTLKCHEQKLKK